MAAVEVERAKVSETFSFKLVYAGRGVNEEYRKVNRGARRFTGAI